MYTNDWAIKTYVGGGGKGGPACTFLPTNLGSGNHSPKHYWGMMEAFWGGGGTHI